MCYLVLTPYCMYCMWSVLVRDQWCAVLPGVVPGYVVKGSHAEAGHHSTLALFGQELLHRTLLVPQRQLHLQTGRQTGTDRQGRWDAISEALPLLQLSACVRFSHRYYSIDITWCSYRDMVIVLRQHIYILILTTLLYVLYYYILYYIII